jgi:hypothetical protein
MSDQNGQGSAHQADILTRPVVYRIPLMDAVTVRQNVTYRNGSAGPLVMDLYDPPARAPGATSLPAVVIAMGYPDPAGRFRATGWTTSWARLIAASGLVAVAYAAEDPAADLPLLLAHLRANAGALGLDPRRTGLLAGSGNVPVALSVLTQTARSPLRCAALCYGFMLDLDASTTVAEAAKTYGFSNPNAGQPLGEGARDVPMFVARAGRDQFAGLNDTLDRFAAEALRRNLPITIVNHPTGPHAFDLVDDSARSHEIVRGILDFLQRHLGVEPEGRAWEAAPPA